MKTNADYISYINANFSGSVKSAMIKQVNNNDRGIRFLLNAKMR